MTLADEHTILTLVRCSDGRLCHIFELLRCNDSVGVEELVELFADSGNVEIIDQTIMLRVSEIVGVLPQSQRHYAEKVFMRSQFDGVLAMRILLSTYHQRMTKLAAIVAAIIYLRNIYR